MRLRKILPLLLAVFWTGLVFGDEPTWDVIVLGATPAGISSAITAARAGEKVLLLEPSSLVGGMMAGGLTKTDLEKTKPYGGMPKEFFGRVVAYYTKTYGADSPQVKDCDQGFAFEPKVAGQLFREWLEEAKVTVRTTEQLEDVDALSGKIESITTRNTKTGAVTHYTAKQFIDATYEGDLMAGAKVMYRVGREARSEYNEPQAGMTAGPKEYLGKGDHRVQSFNIRLTLTNRPDIRLPIPKPENYDRQKYLSLIRGIKAKGFTKVDQIYPLSRWALINGKGDPNKADAIGINFGYPEGDYALRGRITKAVQDFCLGQWWTLQNDPDLPEDFKNDARQWGLPSDEYLDSNHVTPQVYVRVTRRMLGRYMLTEHDLLEDRNKPDTIAIGSYFIDSHVVEDIQTDKGIETDGQMDATPDPYEIPYRCITPYGVKNLLVPVALSATNVAYSSLRMEPIFMMIGQAAGTAAHLANQGHTAVQEIAVPELQAALKSTGVPLEVPFRPVVAIRKITPDPIATGQPVEFEIVEKNVRDPLSKIEWNFDGSGEVQATGTKATHVFSTPGRSLVSAIASDTAANQAMTARTEVQVGENGESNVTEVAADKAKLTGPWSTARGPDVEYKERKGMVDTGKRGDGGSVAVFSFKPQTSGRYKVALAFPSATNRAKNVPIVISHDGGETPITLDERTKPGSFAFVPLGAYAFTAGKSYDVKISNAGAEGYVAIDAVRWIPIGPSL